MASPPINADVLAAMRDAAMATAQAQLKLAAACAAARLRLPPRGSASAG